MDELKANRCPTCSAALWADPKQLHGKLTCPRCSADLWFANVESFTRFALRGSTHPLAKLLENPPPGMDALDFVELVMEIEQSGSAR